MLKKKNASTTFSVRMGRMKLSRATFAQGLADLSINLASAWLGVLLVSPSLLGVPADKWFSLLTSNLPPAILSFVFGLLLLEVKSEL